MDSSDLKTWQVACINAAIRLTVRFLHRLRERMDERGFPRQDPLYRLVVSACDAMHRLSVETHYLPCKLASAEARGNRRRTREVPAVRTSENLPAASRTGTLPSFR